MAMTICPDCGAQVPEAFAVDRWSEGGHPACRAAFTSVLARVAGNPVLLETHQLTVAAYAVQHPAPRSRRAARAVAAHLLALHLMLERGADASTAREAMSDLLECDDDAIGRWDPPVDRGSLTVTDLHETRDPVTHLRIERLWAESAWAAWVEHHPRVREWASVRGDGRPWLHALA